MPPAAPSPRATGAEREPAVGETVGETVGATPLVADIDLESLCNGSERKETKAKRLSEGKTEVGPKTPSYQ